MPPKTTPPPLPDFEDEATLYSLSGEFLEAIRVLIDTPPVQTNYAIVAYYLAGHAAELLLKSFLFKNGDSIEDLRKRYAHDLKLLIKHARLKGLPTRISTAQMQSFSGIYKKKRTEYRKRTPLHLPSLDLLLKEITDLQAYVFDRIAEFDKFD
jgi:hypothetical protein